MNISLIKRNVDTTFRRLCLAVLGCQAVFGMGGLHGLAANDNLLVGKTETALDRYLAKADSSYRWKQIDSGKVGSTEFAVLILTSQTWKGITWKHQLFVLRPRTCAKDCKHALLMISGGSWRDELATEKTELPAEARQFAAIAEQIKTPVAVLRQVPNQPILDGKYEDQIIAFTFEKFIRTGDDSWPLLLPMVKSAHRGMDAVNEFARRHWDLDLSGFTVTGASKRGWTTWLSGATDRRVKAIAPMVIDVLNMKPQMEHQKQVWGDYSNQIDDYTQRGLQDLLSTAKGRDLREIVDPFSYRQRLRQPKLIFIGTNDAYWPIDSLKYYWDELVDQKYVVYVPNNGHGLKDFSRIVGSLHGLHRQAIGVEPMPKLDWKFERQPGQTTLRIEAEEKPDKVQIWYAESGNRDFRKSNWRSIVLKRKDGYRFVQPNPKEGTLAFFGEAIFNRDNFPCYLSTNVQVLTADALKKNPPTKDPSGSK